jgi:hypothetical protein
MRNRILWALAGLNVLLLITLVARFSSENAAIAQARRPSDYIMIPGEVSGGTGAVVYLSDTGAGLLSAIVYDDSRKRIDSMPAIELSRVFAGAVPAAPRTNTPVVPRGTTPATPGTRVPPR